MTAAIITIAVLLVFNISLVIYILSELSRHEGYFGKLNHRFDNIYKQLEDYNHFLLSDIKENRGDLNILAKHLGYKFDTVPKTPSKRILRELQDDSMVAEGVNELEDI